MAVGKLNYYFNFVVLALTFAFIAVRLITESFKSLDLILFSLFIILSMFSLIGIGEKKRWAWVLLMVLFAFLIAYTVGLFFLESSMSIFILIVINIIAFIVSTLSISTKTDLPVPPSVDVPKNSFDKADSSNKTDKLKKELAELVKEKRVLEQEFDELKEEQLVYSPSSKYYHSESCEWAKRIKNKKVITEQEAKKLKLKKHNCLK